MGNAFGWFKKSPDFQIAYVGESPLPEDTITCNGHSYTLISYRCVSENTPYDRGVSAFGTCGSTAICAEFTCLENYEGDLESTLTEFVKRIFAIRFATCS